MSMHGWQKTEVKDGALFMRKFRPTETLPL